MATDLGQIVRQLTDFYDFTAKTVVDVGAGGGQLVEYARRAGRVFAVDSDAAALGRLARRLAELGMLDTFTLIEGDFLAQPLRADVVLLEFCLHEMALPQRALAHAREVAPDVVVIDHAPGSPWSFLAAEEDGVEAAWTAVAAAGVRRVAAVDAVQRFADFSEMEAKMAGQGPLSLQRLQEHRARGGLEIPMPCRMALL